MTGDAARLSQLVASNAYRMVPVDGLLCMIQIDYVDGETFEKNSKAETAVFK